MKIILIRHLETHYNKSGLLQGQMDIATLEPDSSVLNQIVENKKQLNQIPSIDGIFVSELKRTLMTAQYYGYTQNDVIIEPLLNELNFGEFEGKTKAELINQNGELWLNKPSELTLGEPLTELQQRIETFIKKYSNKKCILIFGHGSWSRAFCSWSKYKNIDGMNQMHIPNNELIEIDISL